MRRDASAVIRLIANQGEVGGGEVMLLNLAEALRALGRPVTVIAPESPSEVADMMQQRDFAVERISGRSRRRYLLALSRRFRAGRRRHEILWCNGLLPAVALSGRPRRVVHLHQMPAGALQRLLARVARAGAAMTVVPSEWMATQLPGSIALPNWVTGPDRPAPQRSSRAERGAEPRTEPLIVGFLGRLSCDKGVLDLLRAASLCEAQRPGAVIVHLAGDSRFVPAAETEQIEKAVTEAGSTVRAVGWVERDGFLDGIDLLAVPSAWDEPFGLVAAEAMAAGVPVLVTDAGALPEVVGPEHPLVSRAKDPESLCAVMQRAASSDLASVASEQHERWQQLWSPEAGRRRLQELLAEKGI